MSPEDIKAVFGMQPEAAIAYLQQKRIDISWDWQDMLDDAHATAFTIAKTTRMDIVSDIYQAVNKAIAAGQTLEEFQAELTPVLQSKGWWGRQEIAHPDTGEIQTVQLGSPHRLKTIYLTNTQSAYMAGRYVEMMDSLDTHPYWEYIAINDERTRDSHRLMHGRVYEATDPIWNTMYPPLDYRCRCRVKPLSESRGARRALPRAELETQTVDIGQNEYTGEQRHAQRTGIRVDGKFIAPSPGFNSNQGQAMLSRMASVAVDKAQAAHPDIARVALKEMMTDSKFQNALTPSQLTWAQNLLKG